MTDFYFTDGLPANWRTWTRPQMVKFLEPYGTPFRHRRRKDELIRIINQLKADEDAQKDRGSVPK